MMKKYFLIICLVLVSITSGCSISNAVVETGFESTEVLIDSKRGTKIPATLVTPVKKDEAIPLVVMAHGFNTNREEYGGFKLVAEQLAEAGIASIRLDFPGTKESEESFLAYNFKNIEMDIDSAIAFAKKEVHIDEQRVGALGYSMGGRAISLHLPQVAFNTTVLWAPAASNDWDSVKLFGTDKEMEVFLKQAEKKGTVTFDKFPEPIVLGKEFLQELKKRKPLDALGAYKGNLLVITGGEDSVVTKAVTDKVISAADKTNITVAVSIPQTGHGLGVREADEAATKITIDTTVHFFVDNML